VEAGGAADDGDLAQVTAEQVQVRCFASANSPVYEGVLAKGTVVRVGPGGGEFRTVQLPLGVIGYVSKRFSTTLADGVVQTTGDRVSFRYRPTPAGRAEQPVERLAKGTVLKFLADAGDWWRVRHASASAYLPVDAIQVFSAVNATLEKGAADLASRQVGEWKDAVATWNKAAEVARERAQQRTRVTELGEAFRAESARPLAEQKLEPILAELEKLVTALPEDAPLRAPAQELQRAVETQRLLAQAEQILNSEPPPPAGTKVAIATSPKDKLAHLERFGWLSFHPRSPGAEAFRLMKGGRVISYLKCSTMRYDLSLFHGVEIGISGPARQGETRSYIDVEHLEVLGHAR
jgi:hypothetical protein